MYVCTYIPYHIISLHEFKIKALVYLLCAETLPSLPPPPSPHRMCGLVATEHQNLMALEPSTTYYHQRLYT